MKIPDKFELIIGVKKLELTDELKKMMSVADEKMFVISRIIVNIYSDEKVSAPNKPRVEIFEGSEFSKFLGFETLTNVIDEQANFKFFEMLKSNGFEEADDENWPPNTPGYRLKELLIIRNLKSTQDVYEKFNDLKSGYLKVQADFWQRAYESGRLTIDKLPKEVLPVIKPRLKGASAVGVLDEKIISFSKWSTA